MSTDKNNEFYRTNGLTIDIYEMKISSFTATDCRVNGYKYL